MTEGLATVHVLDRQTMRNQWMKSNSLAKRVLRLPEGKFALIGSVLAFLLIVVGPWVAPYSPTEPGVGLPLAGPSAAHWLGTDTLGRDVLSRVLSGGRDIVWIPFLGVMLAFLTGGVLGMLAAVKRGWADTVFTRTADMALALPPLLILLVILVGAGDSTAIIVLAVALVFAPRVGRVVRGATQSVMTSDFVDVARVRGERTSAIVLREILPNISGVVSVEFAIRFTHAVIFVATLNFLGLGAQPPSPNWGLMIADGRSVIGIQPLATLAPAACVALVSLSLNMLGDAGANVLAREARSGE
jgi:peptide/nickel transport system permease protein